MLETVTIGNIINLGAFGLLSIIMLWLMKVAWPATQARFDKIMESFLEENRKNREHCEHHNRETQIIIEEIKRHRS